MRRFILVAGLVAVLLAPSISFSAGHPLLASVRPLAMARLNEETGNSELRNICTVSSINEKRQLWLTAAHCVDGSEPKYILGEAIQVIMRDVKNDIAIVKTPLASVPALKLAQRGPRVEERVKVMGHPFGFVFPLLTTGTVASESAVLSPEYPPFLLIQVAGAPGNSGSPIVNANNEVVSVLQIGWGRSFSPMMGGTTYRVLVQYASYWQ